MKSEEFWSVELGVRMGPLVLGAEYETVLQVLRDHRIDADRLRLDSSGKLSVPEIQTGLVFSGTYPQTLDRIDVDDDRIRFGSLAVIGKRVHEIIGLFKLSRKKTLWCSLETNGDSPDTVEGDSTSQSRELLARGTIWIPALGLGLTLRDGLVATVHLCDPAQAPQNGSGPWTKEQQLLSEVRELPAISLVVPTDSHRSFALNSLLHLALVAAIVVLIWKAILLQQKWNAVPDTSAVVVALEPPPPHPLPDKITVSFYDSDGVEQRQTLGYMQFMNTPKLGENVSVRYLTDAPNKVLGPVAYRDVGFDYAFPYGVGMLAAYSLVQLVLFGLLPILRRRSKLR